MGERISVAVVVAHPDDDAWMCGAWISQISDQYDCRVIYMTNGVGARQEGANAGVRRAEMLKANEILGYTEIVEGFYIDNGMDQVDNLKITQRIEEIFAEWQPYRIITHSMADLNVDHQATARAVLTACRPFASNVERIYGGEVPSSTECGLRPFEPVFYMTSGDFEKKEAAIRSYAFELRDHPHPRSINGLRSMTMRRAQECGKSVAEAFEVYRWVS